MILLLTKDLMMSSTVSSSVRAAGKTLKVVQSMERAKVKLEELDIELLLVDLQTESLDFELLKTLTSVDAGSRPRMIGYAQHVNIDVIQAGRDAGLDQVLTRGQLHGNIAGVLDG